jgi:hypothetical protein
MELKEEENYLFYPKADTTTGKGLGGTAQASVVCTKNYVFVMPSKKFQTLVVAHKTTTYNFFDSGDSPAEGLSKLVAEPGLTVDALEAKLVPMLSEGVKEQLVFKVDELDKFKVTSGFFGKTTMKSAGGKEMLLTLRGKDSKKRMKAFYGQ